MKKVLLISFAIAFGVTTAMMVVSITLIATGVVRQNIFGGYSFAFDGRKAESDASDYERKSAIAKALVVTDPSIVGNDDEKMKKIVCNIENPNDDLLDELVSFDVLLIKGTKVVSIVRAIDTISLKKGESKRFIIDVMLKEKVEYDSVEMLPKG